MLNANYRSYVLHEFFCAEDKCNFCINSLQLDIYFLKLSTFYYFLHARYHTMFEPGGFEHLSFDYLTLQVLVTTIDALKTLLNRVITAQWEGMGDVRSARYEPALLPPCPTIRVLCYSNCQRLTHSLEQFKG